MDLKDFLALYGALHICYRMIISKELFGIKLTKIGERNGQKRKDTFIYVFKRIYSA